MSNDLRDTLLLTILLFATAIFCITVPNASPPQTHTYYQSHTVERGETLSEIVQLYNGSLKSTQAYNGKNVIMPGDEIEIVVEVER